jgi:hypothetical protein
MTFVSGGRDDVFSECEMTFSSGVSDGRMDGVRARRSGMKARVARGG